MDAEPSDVTIAVVGQYPDCDVHLQMFGIRVPAGYDGPLKSNGMWAYMCVDCFPRWSTGQLGLGHGQRLVLADARGQEA